MASDNSDRALAYYYVAELINLIKFDVDDESFFDKEEFHHFMSRNYPTKRMTVSRIENFKKYYKDAFDRMLKPINKSLDSYK